MNIRICLHFVWFLFFSSLLIAQSDYRITQEFKSRHRSFEIAIEYAKTNDELNKIKKEINEFKNEFKGNKELLNRALYPSNFEASFSTLSKKIEYTNKKLAEISTLQTRVTQVEADYSKVSKELQKLSSEVNSLRNTNSRLMTELKAFKSGYGGSKGAIDSLKNLVAQLKQGISKRDTLIKEIMDNIFMTAEHKIESLDDAERKGIQAQIKNTSLIDNIRNLINDNLEFLNASLFTSNDLGLLREEFRDFDQRWSHFGPKLFDIYSSDPQNQGKLHEIDTLITNWDSTIKVSVWRSIHNIFSNHNIAIDNFEDGLEFENVILDYIDSEINNETEIEGVKKDKNYVFFAERVWQGIIKNDWMPLVLSENLLDTEQVSNIDAKLNQWKDSLTGTKSYFIYGIILILALIIIGSVILINKKQKASKTKDISVDKDEIEKTEGEIGSDDKFVDDD